MYLQANKQTKNKEQNSIRADKKGNHVQCANMITEINTTHNFKTKTLK